MFCPLNIGLVQGNAENFVLSMLFVVVEILFTKGVGLLLFGKLENFAKTDAGQFGIPFSTL
jgi:hypothetical protein